MKHYLRLILILAIPLAVALLYAASGLELPTEGYSLASINLDGKWFSQIISGIDFTFQGDTTDADTLQTEDQETRDEVPVDTTHKRILFFGDSMVEGLSVRLADYVRENGYELYSVSWYGSTTIGWASHLDSLQNWLAWSSPDFVMVSIGGNELDTKDTRRRTESIGKIMSVIGTRPCVWIGTPSWIPNPTITEIERKAVGNRRYFDSMKLTLKRAPDHMHPTYPAYSQWMDSIAMWLQSQHTEYPIRMHRPDFKGSRIHNMIVLDVHGKRKNQQAAPAAKPDEETLPKSITEPETEPTAEPLQADTI